MQESEIGEYIRTQTLPSIEMVKKAKALVIKALRSKVVNESSGCKLGHTEIKLSLHNPEKRDNLISV